MQLKVAKFGGSSLADARCFRQAARIIKADPSRRYIVVSAPGKRGNLDTKITDLLLGSLSAEDSDAQIDEVAERFLGIIENLRLQLSIEDDIVLLKKAARQGLREYVVSRGEYISAKIMAALLEYDFVDAKDMVCFAQPYVCDRAKTRRLMKIALKDHACAVIPGFYGSDAEGNIRTFLRGGSDITGAIVADATEADCYENWTDVSGVFTADPNAVSYARGICHMTYDELRVLSHLGANVMHEDAVLPCEEGGIPIRIRNTHRFWEDGTLVDASAQFGVGSGVVGLSSKGDMAVLRLRTGNQGLRDFHKVQGLLQSMGLSPEGIQLDDLYARIALNGRSVRSCEMELCKVLSGLNIDYEIVYDLAQIGVLCRGLEGKEKIRMYMSATLEKAYISAEMICAYEDRACITILVEQMDGSRAMNCLHSQLIHNTKLTQNCMVRQKIHTAAI